MTKKLNDLVKNAETVELTVGLSEAYNIGEYETIKPSMSISVRMSPDAVPDVEAYYKEMEDLLQEEFNRITLHRIRKAVERRRSMGVNQADGPALLAMQKAKELGQYIKQELSKGEDNE